MLGRFRDSSSGCCRRHNRDMDDARKLLIGKRYDHSVDLNTKLNVSMLTPQCKILAKIILHNVLPQGGHFDNV